MVKGRHVETGAEWSVAQQSKNLIDELASTKVQLTRGVEGLSGVDGRTEVSIWPGSTASPMPEVSVEGGVTVCCVGVTVKHSQFRLVVL